MAHKGGAKVAELSQVEAIVTTGFDDEGVPSAMLLAAMRVTHRQCGCVLSQDLSRIPSGQFFLSGHPRRAGRKLFTNSRFEVCCVSTCFPRRANLLGFSNVSGNHFLSEKESLVSKFFQNVVSTFFFNELREFIVFLGSADDNHRCQCLNQQRLRHRRKLVCKSRRSPPEASAAHAPTQLPSR